MRRWQWIGILVVIVAALVIGIFLLIVGGNAPTVSSVAKQACVTSAQADASATCLRFPVVSGDNLTGQAFTLPTDFKGKDVLVIVPFDENQQVSAQTWLPLARDLAASDADFAYYNVPVFPSMAAPLRTLIRTGMNATISDSQLRAITVTVFLDNRDQFLTSLNIPDVSTMQIFLLDSSGEVLWRGTGAFTSAQGAALKAALAD